MQHCEICDTAIIVATKEEIRSLWKDPAIDNSQIFSEEESWEMVLYTPEQLEAVLKQKKIKPGSYAPPTK